MPTLTDISLLYRCRLEGGQDDVQPIRNAAVSWDQGMITWVGPESDLPSDLGDGTTYSARGGIVVPGLIDCHTHLCFGGWRADEFEQRIRGASYLDIARSGGGIRRTMRQTRESSDDALLAHCLSILDQMVRLGVTTVECKSGYGLSRKDELRQLRTYARLRDMHPVGIVSTFLGAHVVPPEFDGDRVGYIRLLCEDLIPCIADERLADFCDVFVEETAFSTEEAAHILSVAADNGLGAKMHVDQLSDGGGASLAARLGAVSADHLEYASDEGIAAMATKHVVGVCLPLATLYLRQKPMPVGKFTEAGVPVAVATDFNPGSAPSFHLPLAMMLACTMNGLTPAGALKAATMYAAVAIGKEAEIGSIEIGKSADLAVMDVSDVNQWMYHFRPNACTQTYIRGILQK